MSINIEFHTTLRIPDQLLLFHCVEMKPTSNIFPNPALLPHGMLLVIRRQIERLRYGSRRASIEEQFQCALRDRINRRSRAGRKSKSYSGRQTDKEVPS